MVKAHAQIEAVGMHRGKAALFTIGTEESVFDDNGETDAADAERLAACWNAFSGVPTERIVALGSAAAQALLGGEA